MFKNKKKCYSLKDIEYHKEDYIVQKVERNCRFYLRFDSCYSFFHWYKDIKDEEKTFNEVIMSGPQKMKIDIDNYPGNIYQILDYIKDILFDLGIESPKIILYDIKKSYHIVISNYHFESNIHCIYVASKIKSRVDIDESVYKSVQHFRVEGSTKYGELRWKRRLLESFTSSTFSEGAISYISNSRYAEINIHDMPKRISPSTDVRIEGLRDFKVRGKLNNIILLDRIRSSYCNICKRIHDKDNAYMIGSKFYCRRAF